MTWATRYPAEGLVPYSTEWIARYEELDLGWVGPADIGEHVAFFLYHDGVRIAIAHVFTSDQSPEAHLRLFADWLRRHSQDRDRYAILKQRLYEAGVRGTDYTDAKGHFVQAVVARARAERGLSPLTSPL